MTEFTGKWSLSGVETFLDPTAILLRVACRSLLVEERDEAAIRIVPDGIARRDFTERLADVEAESACLAER